MIERSFDEETGIVSVVGHGVWSFADIEHHYAALRAMIAELRAAGRPVRVLSDVTAGQRQAAWVEEYILLQMQETFAAGDRIALLAGSEADKMHVQSLLSRIAMMSFTVRAEAERWLLAPD